MQIQQTESGVELELPLYLCILYINNSVQNSKDVVQPNALSDSSQVTVLALMSHAPCFCPPFIVKLIFIMDALKNNCI